MEEEYEKKKKASSLDDEEDLESLDDYLAEDELSENREFDDDESLEDDPWEKQIRLGKKQGQEKFNIW